MNAIQRQVNCYYDAVALGNRGPEELARYRDELAAIFPRPTLRSRFLRLCQQVDQQAAEQALVPNQ